MSCVHCARGIEKGLSREPGIISIRVFLADESAEIEFDPERIAPDAIAGKISALGYPARFLSLPRNDETGWEPVAFTALLAVPVFVLSMFASPSWANRFAQMVLSGLIIMTTGKRFFLGAVRALKLHQFTMDVLVALGVGASWSYSTLIMAVPALDHQGMVHFETAAVLVLFILLGKTLESLAKRQATASLKSLTAMQFGSARRLGVKGSPTASAPELVEAEQLNIDDLVQVLPGERFLADGVVVSGESNADESLLTGESLPVPKFPGQSVISGALNITGEMVIAITRCGADSTLQSLVRAVRKAQADKPAIQRFADQASEYFVPAVLLLAGTTLAGWLLTGHSLNVALMHAVTVLVVACPCALGLATPMAIVVSSALAMKRGLLVKKPSALEALADIKFLLLDKTGTLTTGRPLVQDIFSATQAQSDWADIAAVLASRSLHPLSKALAESRPPSGDTIPSFRKVTEQRGFGLIGTTTDGSDWLLGSPALLEENGYQVPALPESWVERAFTPVWCAGHGHLQGAFGLADTPKPDAAEAVRALVAKGILPVMVSGDLAEPAHAIARHIGITEVKARVRPEQKCALVKEYLQRGPTAFVGDGVNDAPALSAATVGLAMGSGADAAREATDLVLIGKDLLLLPFAVELSRATRRKIRQNLFWAAGYNVVMLPLATGLLAHWWGPAWELSPMLAGLAMGLSSVSVVANSLLLRLNRF